jgi:hypothetical protein
MNRLQLVTQLDLAVETAPIMIVREEYNEKTQTRYQDTNSIQKMANTKKMTGTTDPRGVKDTDDHGSD